MLSVVLRRGLQPKTTVSNALRVSSKLRKHPVLYVIKPKIPALTKKIFYGNPV
jgi:hypothetical protein